MTSALQAKLNILHYYADYRKDKNASYFKVNPVNEDIFILNCIIPGPSNSIWSGGEFTLQLNFPKDFPANPPQGVFITPIFHPNVYPDGRICLDILDPSQWKKETTMEGILLSAQTLLVDPNSDSPVNNEANELYLEFKKDNSNDKYEKMVKECVEKSKIPLQSNFGMNANKPMGGTLPGWGSWNAPSSNKFGAPSSNPFGAPSSNPFGAPSSNLFATQSSNKFDAPSSNLFGDPSSNKFTPSNPFGAPSSNPFGAPSSNKFTAPSSNPFATQSSNKSAAPSTSNTFGATPKPQDSSNTFTAPSKPQPPEVPPNSSFISQAKTNEPDQEENSHITQSTEQSVNSTKAQPAVQVQQQDEQISAGSEQPSQSTPPSAPIELPAPAIGSGSKAVVPIPLRIENNQYVMLNRCNLSTVEEAAKTQGKTNLVQQCHDFKQYLDAIKVRLNESYEFTELVAMELIVFGLNESNKDDYVAATKALVASSNRSATPSLSLSKQLARAIINAFFTRINDHDLLISFVKDLKSDDLECILHCQLKRQIKIFTADEMKQKSFKQEAVEIPSFLKYVINKLNVDESQANASKFAQRERPKICEAIIKDDVESLKQELEGKEIDFKKYKIDFDSNERSCFPKKRHGKQLHKQEKDDKPTLLEYAAFYGSSKCFDYLHSVKNCKITKNISKHTLCGGNESIFNKVAEAGKSFLEDIECAIKFHHFELFKKVFLSYYSDYKYDEKFSYEKVQKKLWTSCIKFFNFRALRFLIEFGVDVNDCMINEALKRDIHSLFIFLMGLNVDINVQDKNDFSAIHCAIRAGNVPAVITLLRTKKVDLNIGDHCGRSSIHFAAIVGNIEIFNILAKLPGVDLNRLDDEDMTPLHYATREGKFEIVKRLLTIDKINPDIKNSAYMTPLHYACMSGRKDIVELLLSIDGIDVNPHDIGNWCPIHYAVDNNFIEIVKLLLASKNVNPNVIDNTDSTPLICAMEGKKKEIVDLLLAQPQIDINLINNSHRSPIVIACLQENQELIDRLLARDDIILNKEVIFFKKEIKPEVWEKLEKRREQLGQEPSKELAPPDEMNFGNDNFNF